jgi:two-component system nitrogen regulation response regulator GlnG
MAPGQTVEVKDMPADLIEERANNTEIRSPIVLGAAEVKSTSGGVTIGGDVSEGNWLELLKAQAAQMLSDDRPEVMDVLGRQFEATLIKTALKHTHGRKNDAAVRLGIGRNTITRKIQELGIDDVEVD